MSGRAHHVVAGWVRRATAALLLSLYAPQAHAEWVLTGYVGAAATSSNTLKLASQGTDVRVGPVVYEGRSWESPIYYGGRLAYFPAAWRWIGIEGEFTHLKAIADTSRSVSIRTTTATGEISDSLPLSEVLPRFELSHGLNFALINAVARGRLPGPGGRLALLGRAGIGATMPHLETTFAGMRRDEYQSGRLGWQAGGGAEWRVWGRFHVVGDVRLTRTSPDLDIGTGTTLSGTFQSRQVDIGIAWHSR